MKSMRTLITPLLLAVAMAGLPGCGGGKSNGSSSSSASTGRSVSGTGQLVGTWFRATEGPFAGLEFMRDGSVIVTPVGSDLSSAITMKYHVLDGGRISLVQPDGQTMILQAKVSGAQLALINGELMGPAGFQGFRRLRSGETLAQAAKEERVAQEKAREAKEKARQERLAALGQFLGQPKLAIVSSDPKLHLDRMALDVKGANGSWTGVAYVEGPTPAARQTQVVMANPAGEGQPYRVVVRFGQVVGPPGMKQLPAESMIFLVKGRPGHFQIEGNGRALQPDAAAYDDIAARYRKVVAEREAIIAKFAGQFGSFTRLDGTLRYPNNPNGRPQRMVLGLLRVQGKPAFLWTDMGRDSNPGAAAFTQPAVVVLDGEKPYLDFGSNLGALEAVNAGGKTTLQGRIQGMNAVFAPGLTMSREELVKRRAAVAEFIDHTLAAGVGLSGVYTENNLNTSPVWAVHFDLKNVGGRNLGGTYFAPWETRFPITGKVTDTLLGAHLEIRCGKGVDFFGEPMNRNGPSFVFDVEWDGGTMERTFVPRARGPAYNFKLGWKAGEPAFHGTMPGHSIGNRFDLFVDSRERLRETRRRIDQLLASGLTFSRRRRGGPVLKLKVDPSGGVSAETIYQWRRNVLPAPTTVREDEENGFVVFRLAEAGVPSSNRVPNGISAGKFRLCALLQPDGLLLTGSFAQAGLTPRTLAAGRNEPPGFLAFWAPTK